MNARDWFGLVVRTFGLIAAVASCFYFLAALAAGTGVSHEQGASPLEFVIFGVVMAVVGFYLLRGAPTLLHFAYPKAKESEGKKSDA